MYANLGNGERIGERTMEESVKSLKNGEKMKGKLLSSGKIRNTRDFRRESEMKPRIRELRRSRFERRRARILRKNEEIDSSVRIGTTSLLHKLC